LTTTHISTTKLSATLAKKGWWLSLYPHLSTKGKRGLMVVCLGGMMLAQSIGLMDSSSRSYSPYDNPAVQNALHQLGLNAPRDPIGDQFQVNSYTTDDQLYPAVALDSDGDFVVVWMSNGSNYGDTDIESIQGQRYNSVGTAQGSQFQVNSYTTGSQAFPAVSLDSDGDFVVIWESYGSIGDTNLRSIQGQRYNSLGVPQDSQFQVNSYTENDQRFPDVAMDSDGDFVVVWQSYGSNGSDTSFTSIQGQRYNSVGVPEGSEFQVNSYTSFRQRHPAVALDSDGDFVVVWESNGGSGTDTLNYSVQAQRYNSVGISQGSQFQVNSYITGNQRDPAVALDSDGDFIVVWRSDGSSYGDTDSASIQGQRYNSAGTAQGSQFQVNTYTTSEQEVPDVAVDSDGDFVVVWGSYGSSGSDYSGTSIQGQAYNSVGVPQGSEFQVNSYITSHQHSPGVGLDSNGNFVVVWRSYGSSGDDTSGRSIQGQRYSAGGITPTPTPTLTPTNTLTPSPTSTNTPTPSTTPTDTPTPTNTLTPTPTSTDTPTPSVTPTDTPNPTNTPTPTSTPMPAGRFIYLPAVISDSSP
jgi:hypothetical protein